MADDVEERRVKMDDNPVCHGWGVPEFYNTL
jgi:hypothetical protein